MTRKDGPIKPETILFEVIEKYPQARKKVVEFFGKKCLSCPSSKKETVAYTAFHKGYDPEYVVREFNAAIREEKRGKR